MALRDLDQTDAESGGAHEVAHCHHTQDIFIEYQLTMFGEHVVSISSTLADAPQSPVCGVKSPTHCNKTPNMPQIARDQIHTSPIYTHTLIHMYYKLSKSREKLTSRVFRTRASQSHHRIRRVQSDLSSKLLPPHNSDNTHSHEDIIAPRVETCCTRTDTLARPSKSACKTATPPHETASTQYPQPTAHTPTTRYNRQNKSKVPRRH